ncbi:hypothetical protein [Gemmiger formicilis]
MIVAARNRKLYSLVLSCTHHGKIPAEKFGFLCFLVFYLFVQAFPVQVKPVRATPAQEKPFLDKKAPKAGNLERYLAGHAPCRCGLNAPKQGRFSRRQGRCVGLLWRGTFVQLLAGK